MDILHSLPELENFALLDVLLEGYIRDVLLFFLLICYILVLLLLDSLADVSSALVFSQLRLLGWILGFLDPFQLSQNRSQGILDSCRRRLEASIT